MTRQIAGLSEVASRFDAVVADQYGVLHDGCAAFPGTREALEALAGSGVPVVALTNSGKRAAANAERLARLGFPGSLFRAVISSGELARARLAALPPGSPVLLVAREGETGLIDGLGLCPAGPADEAAAVIIAAVEPQRRDRAAYAAMLAPHARRGTPALLVNPDLITVDGGAAVFGPGAVAEDYAAAGGPVEFLGKPAPAMYEAALAALGHPDPARTLMIGDSPLHDIAGARAAGLATLLIRGGVQSGLPGAEADFAAERLAW
ncbi:TIGR01459 family HAD-type hydrolase [Poseidonocella sp. HB161398]|uniref:TIGR01459 family HAD-type hydrolase n=1 Tax=Poseidonocella sp. HB161398 TaxID=2320855 RepID=UPI001108EB85|nr:TIGR01459 family HAD-type hydrolase [Poseidonocella sp. HB161398]